ncbi:hypothetical protein PpBr36_07998 [Pyricularia pennisetigena]|uniref:hypothetical protein n=1 Tax=Pyricularia pennisetigena TaxID=1578925 RepID=UPI00114E9C0A|nr:hypothetical protein PpBr36_07998 [Pyricularia pennisetigena]TLS24173.1 hypothetical protein PpBr36_07998 [Pyricularia pennisetigena]
MPLTIIGLVTAIYLTSRVMSFVRLYVCPSRIGRYLHCAVNETRSHEATVGTGQHGRQLTAELAAVEAESRREFPAREFCLLSKSAVRHHPRAPSISVPSPPMSAIRP